MRQEARGKRQDSQRSAPHALLHWKFVRIIEATKHRTCAESAVAGGGGQKEAGGGGGDTRTMIGTNSIFIISIGP